MSNEYSEICGVYCKYTHDRYEQMVDFIQKVSNFSIDNSEREHANYLFLIKRRGDFHLCTGYNPTSIDVEVSDINGLQSFYEREISKLSELL